MIDVALSYSLAQTGHMLFGGNAWRAGSPPMSAAPLAASHCDVVDAKPLAYPPSRSTPNGKRPATLCARRADETTCGAQLRHGNRGHARGAHPWRPAVHAVVCEEEAVMCEEERRQLWR